MTYADNCFLIGTNLSMLQTMWSELTISLLDSGLTWKKKDKEGKSCLELISSADLEADSLNWQVMGFAGLQQEEDHTFEIAITDCMRVLGTWIDKDGGNNTNVEQRKAAGTRTFYQSKKDFTSTDADRREKVKAWSMSPVSSCLWSSQTWIVSWDTLRELRS